MIRTFQEFFPWVASLPFSAKILISAALVFMTGFVLVLIWASPKSDSPSVAREPSSAREPMWPEEKSLEALRRRLDRVSNINRFFLREVAHSGKNGLYVGDLQTRMNLERDQVVYRGNELELLQLVEILDLTDKNYRLAESVWRILGPNEAHLLDALLD
jgi:hypothetical protein